MSEPGELPPVRVRISHPRLAGRPVSPVRPATQEIDEQTKLGELYVRALVQSQLRQAVLICGAALLGLVGIALAFAARPALGRARLFGMPLAWLVLGVLIYPALIGLAWLAVGRAERTERDFMTLVRRR
ncbi:MAG TPA: hypothetical protein VHO01_01255 [Jatrophihabitans sp.]|nr:hypothetical protein [Jatrophihabitans sp.]